MNGTGKSSWHLRVPYLAWLAGAILLFGARPGWTGPVPIANVRAAPPEAPAQPHPLTVPAQEILPPPHLALPGVDGCVPTSPPLFTPAEIFSPDTEVLLIDLPTALRVANASNPTIAFARAREEEAYYRLRQAQVLWLPNFDMGMAYLRHDGNIQNATGIIFPTSKSSLGFFGGPSLWAATSDILFDPLIARRVLAAQQATAQAVNNDVQLNVALAYLDLLQVYGQLAVNADTLARAESVLIRAKAADIAELSKKADLPRIRTEYQLRLQERIAIRGQIRIASSRLARLLVLRPSVGLVPAEPALAPITLIPEDGSVEELIAQASRNRPELVASQALISASEVRLRKAHLEPLLPHVGVTYYGGAFGGGLNETVSDFRPRGDATVQAVWELRNLGFGNLAEARVRRAEVAEANLHAVEVQAQVGDEVNQAVQLARARREALASGQEAIRQAVEMFRRLDIIAFGILGPKKEPESLEPLLAIQALAQARTQYLNAVMDYNRAQFQLFTAVGLPSIDAPPKASPLPIEVSPAPAPYVPPRENRQP
jgi:outer membrane protein TolC